MSATDKSRQTGADFPVQEHVLTSSLPPTTHRVLHIDTGMELRGGQHQLLLLARGLRGHGHEQLIVCCEASLLESRSRQEGFHVWALPAHDPANLHGALQLRGELMARRFDIIHAHDGRGQTIEWLASVGLPMRRVAHRRVTFAPSLLAGGRLIQGLKYRHTCDAVIAVSGFVRRLLLEAGVPDRMIHVIPDGIELPPQLPSCECRRRVRHAWGLAEDAFAVGSLGALSAEKGPDLLIQAATLLQSRRPEASFVLALPKSGRVPALALPPNVRTLVTPEDLGEFFAGLDLYLMPSRAEGLGSSALLAMAWGLPVVAGRAGGLPEVVDEGKTGWLVPPDSATVLADAIFEAARDPARLKALGLNARGRASHFSSDIMLRRTEALYERLLGRASPTARDESEESRV